MTWDQNCLTAPNELLHCPGCLVSVPCYWIVTRCGCSQSVSCCVASPVLSLVFEVPITCRSAEGEADAPYSFGTKLGLVSPLLSSYGLLKMMGKKSRGSKVFVS